MATVQFYDRGKVDDLLAGKADKSTVEPLLFSQYYPDGSVKSAAEFTAGIKYDAPDTTNRTITVKPFCNTGTATDDNSSLAGHVVIPPFVDAQGNGYISDDGTRCKVVGVNGGSSPYGSNTGLTTIVTPTTVTSIGEDAFNGCTSLTSVSLPAVMTTIGESAFNRCTSLTSVSLPAVTGIGRSAFGSCTALSSISLPAVTTIENSAFAECFALSSISLPAVTKVEKWAFDGCNNLSSVDFGNIPRSSVPTLSINAFESVPTTCKIIVPYTQYNEWKAASGWSALPQEFVRHAEKSDKPATFTTGNLAEFDADGNPVDSGVKPSDKLASTSAAPAWVSGTPYTANALVTYNGAVYRCKANTVSPHTATPDADTTHWEAKKVSDLFLPLAGGTMTGDIGIQASYGIVFSSGDADAVKLEIGYLDGTQVPKLGSRFLAYLDALPYSLVTKTISNNAVALDDRAVNLIVQETGQTNIVIGFPAETQGKVRDFVLYFDCSEFPPAIQWNTYAELLGESTTSLDPEEGMNVYAFTEISRNKFYVSHKLLTSLVNNAPADIESLIAAMNSLGYDTSSMTTLDDIREALGLPETTTLEDCEKAILN